MDLILRISLYIQNWKTFRAIQLGVVVNVNWRKATPEKISWVSLSDFPGKLTARIFLELFRRPASNKVKGAADENPGFAALIELWRKRSLIRVMRNSCG
jgi:hypothetical protein